MYNALTLEQSQTNKNVYSIFIMIFSEFLEGAGHGFWEYLEKKKSTAQVPDTGELFLNQEKCDGSLSLCVFVSMSLFYIPTTAPPIFLSAAENLTYFV